MNNQIFGTLTIFLCSVGYFFSWKFQAKDNFKIAVLLLMLCGLALRVFTACDFFLNTWDERYHALVAKNLIHHPLMPTLYDNPVLPYNFGDWTNNHVWLAKPPFALWAMSASIFLFGNNEIAIRIPSIILSTLGILVTFNIAKLLFNNKIAWLAAFFYSIHGMLIELAGGRISSDHVETFFVFFTELSILFAIFSVQKERKTFLWLLLSGICTGIAILCKFLPALIVLPVWFLLAYSSKKFTVKNIFTRLLFLISVLLCVSLPWFAYTSIKFPAEAKEMFYSFGSPLNNVVQEHTGSVWYYVDKLRIIFGEIIYLPLCWMLYLLIKKNRSLWLVVLSSWILIPVIIFSFAETKRHTYLMLIAPAIFMLTSAFWNELSEHKKNQKLKWLLNLLLILIVALPIRYSIERIKPFEKRDRNPQWSLDLKKLNDEGATNNSVLFNCQKPIEAMFYTNVIAYSLVPEKKIIDSISNAGYKIIINDDGKLPSDISSLSNVRYVKLSSTE